MLLKSYPEAIIIWEAEGKRQKLYQRLAKKAGVVVKPWNDIPNTYQLIHNTKEIE